MPNKAEQYPRLAELTRQLQESDCGQANLVEWRTTTGVVMGIGIHDEPPGEGELEPGGRTAICYMQEGDEFPPHTQEWCTEILIVFGGLLEVTVEDGETGAVVLGPGMHIALQPGVVHRARALTRCCVQGTTIPKDDGYPHGTRTEQPRPW